MSNHEGQETKPWQSQVENREEEGALTVHMDEVVKERVKEQTVVPKISKKLDFLEISYCLDFIFKDTILNEAIFMATGS